jgi:hypothetical protein
VNASPANRSFSGISILLTARFEGAVRTGINGLDATV